MAPKDDPDLTGVGERRGSRWKRRAVSIPTMLAATAAAFAGAPLVVVALATADLAHGRTRLPRVRVYGVVLQYLFNDSVEILASPWLWLAAGFGTRIDSQASRRRHGRLQKWSVDILARRAEQLLGLRMHVEGLDRLGGAPAIVLSRHASLLDASLPPLLYRAAARRNRSAAVHGRSAAPGRSGTDRGDDGYEVRGVIAAEMLLDPGFDLLYPRLGSVFINRHRGTRARAAIEEMGGRLGATSVAVIFPEGRLFDRGALDGALSRLAETDPERAARLGRLQHVLPPRPGGVGALLDGAPTADVVIIEHFGFERIPTLAELSRAAPVDHTIKVRVRRIPRSQVPDGEPARTAWLDDQWLALDDWIGTQIGAGSGTQHGTDPYGAPHEPDTVVASRDPTS